MFNFLRNYGVEKTASAKKLIQSFHEFEKKFPREEDSIEHFAQIVIQELGVACRLCSSASIERKYGSRFFRCQNCKSKGWIFSGTFFQKMRIAKLWNATIWLYERRIQFNAWQLAELCKVAYSSALVISRKIAKVIFSMAQDRVQLVPSAVFMVLFRKRSIETPANLHPKFEQHILDESMLKLQNDEIMEDLEKDVDCEVTDSKTLSDLESKVLELLSETPVHFDYLCSQLLISGGGLAGILVMLEIKDLVVLHPGDYYTIKVKRANLSKRLRNRRELVETFLNSNRVEEFFKFAISNFHGFSRKYLQFYLMKSQAFFQDNFMSPGKILRQCLNLDSFSYFQMLEYVSPEDVALWI